MAIVYSYPQNDGILSSDILVGTSTKLYAGKPINETKNFNVLDLGIFITGLDINNLDTVLHNGNTSLLDANVGRIGLFDQANLATMYISANNNTYTLKTVNANNTISAQQGLLSVYKTNSISGSFSTSLLNSNRTYQLPDASGTIALTTDIPDPITLTTVGTSGVATLIGDVLNIPNYSAAAVIPTLDEVLTAGNTSLLNIYAGEELGLYDAANSNYSTLNAFDNTFTFNNSDGDPVLYFEQGILAISKSNTISGTVNTSLLSASRNYSLPNASGTIALTSDIPSLTGYVQTTRTLTINGTTYDLSANRTWSVGTVTGVTATGLITSTGGTAPVISTQIHTNVLVGRTTAGTGTMEEITVGSGLTLSAGTLSATSTGGGIPHTTASGTDTYTATVASVTSYADGDAYLVRFTNGNTTGATLNINGLGAIPLYRNNDGAVIGGDIWDGAEMLCVYNSTTTAFQCIGTSSNSLFAYVTNADSVAITKGQPVYAFGGTGDRLTVKRALNTSDATSAQTVGVVLTSSIAVNQKGIIIIQGLLDGLSILPTSTWADGDPVYLGTTAGSITNVKQYAPNHLVYLGTVTTASNGSSGRWYVRVQNGYELDELHNVQAQSPSLKDTLWYDSGVTPGQWKTASIPTILGYTPFNLPSLTSGSVIFSNGTTLTQDNANFFWDDTNNRLGVGTATPSESLTIRNAGNRQILLENSAGGIEGITSSQGGNLASFDMTTGGWYRYGPLQMLPATMDITFAGQDVFYGNITSDFIPKRATIGFADSLIYDDGTNVGIGTSIPATKLDVNGVITATGGNSTSWNAKQDAITLTTTGTSGSATLVGSTLNIPQYSGGGGGSTPVKLTSQTLTAASWTLSGGYYTYAFSDVNVTTTCDVSVTPQNASYQTAYNANVLPFIGVAAGVATFYSQFPPAADMVVDIVITQTT